MRESAFMRGYRIGQEMYKDLWSMHEYEEKMDNSEFSEEERECYSKEYYKFLRKNERHEDRVKVVGQRGDFCIQSGLLISILGHPIKYVKSMKMMRDSL